VLQALKKMNPAPRVIMLTNYSSDLYRKKCTALGADFFLDKTTEFDKIPDIFKRLRQEDKT
jgi:DNA-binding NarL/FixJ family response regulator